MERREGVCNETRGRVSVRTHFRPDPTQHPSPEPFLPQPQHPTHALSFLFRSLLLLALLATLSAGLARMAFPPSSSGRPRSPLPPPSTSARQRGNSDASGSTVGKRASAPPTGSQYGSAGRRKVRTEPRALLFPLALSTPFLSSRCLAALDQPCPPPVPPLRKRFGLTSHDAAS